MVAIEAVLGYTIVMISCDVSPKLQYTPYEMVSFEQNRGYAAIAIMRC